MRLYVLLISVLLFSCGSDTIERTKKTERKTVANKEAPIQLHSSGRTFNNHIFSGKSFSNGDAIWHAQSKEEWAKASREGIPAWCYVDSERKEGILYNGFCLQDERGLGKNAVFMDELEGSRFVKNATADPAKNKKAQIYSTERNYMGNFYDIGFHNIWLKNSDAAKGKEFVLCCRYSDGRLTLRRAHPGNGYYVRTLKKNK